MAGSQVDGRSPSAVLLSKGDEDISVAESGRPAGREDHVALVGRHVGVAGAELLVGDWWPELCGAEEAAVSLARSPIEVQVLAILPVAGEVDTAVRDDYGVQLLRRGAHGRGTSVAVAQLRRRAGSTQMSLPALSAMAPDETAPGKYSSWPSGETDMSTATARAPPGNSDSGFGSFHFPSRKTELWIVSTPSTMRVKKNSRPSGVKRR